MRANACASSLLQGAEPGDYRWLAGELLEYHRREARPAWWWYFERLGMTPDELVEDSESIGCLEADRKCIAGAAQAIADLYSQVPAARSQAGAGIG